MDFYFTPRSLISVQVRGAKAFTSLVAILKSAALDTSLLQAGWWTGHAQAHPTSCGSPMGNQHTVAQAGAVGIHPAFQLGQDKLPVSTVPMQQSPRP